MNIRIKTDITSEVLSAKDLNPFIKYEDMGESEIAIIDDMITAVRAHFEQRTGLSFAERTYEIYFNETPYVIPVTPVISVDKVETIDYLGVKSELVLNSGYYKRGLYEVEIITGGKAISNPFVSFPERYQILVTCKAGYGHDDTETLPGDIAEAIKRQVFQWYENRDDFYEQKLLGSVDKIIKLHRTTWV